MGDTGDYRVSVKAVVYREDGTILAIRRSKTAPTRPLQWDIPGGELEYGESLIDGVRRETREETGLEGGKVDLLDAIARFNDKQEFWTAICYAVKAETADVKLSYEHDDYRWVTPEEFEVIQPSSRNTEFVAAFARRKGEFIV